jgi:hypothetical protein
MSNTAELEVRIGTTYSSTVTVRDSSGELEDLTGSSFQGQVRTTPLAVAVLASFSFVISNQTTNKGEVVISLPANSFTGLTLGESKKVFYDILRTFPDSSVKEFFGGQISLKPGVTR